MSLELDGILGDNDNQGLGITGVPSLKGLMRLN